MKSYSIVESDSNLRPMARLALPALAEEFLVLMVTWTDWWLTGHFFQVDGDATKTAMSLMGYFMWLVPSMFAAVAIGATAVVARMVGSADFGGARKTTNQAFLIGLFAAVGMTSLVFWLGDAYIQVMQLRGDAAKYAQQYLDIIVWSIPWIMCSQVGAACLRGAGDTVTGFVAKSMVVLCNILISTTLVAGLGPFPEVGWRGLAIGTAVGHCIGGIILLTVLIYGRAGLRLNWREMAPDWSLISRILRIGIPGGFDVAVLLLSQMIFLAIIMSLGDSAAAAHGLAVQLEAICFLPGSAFQVAATTMSGQFLGARKPDRATHGILICLGFGTAIMTVGGIVLYVAGGSLAHFFTGDWNDPTTSDAAGLLRIVALVMPCLALTMIVSGGLRGAGDTLWPFLFTVIGFFVIRIPLAAYFALEEIPWLTIDGQHLPGMGLGIRGAWYAMVLDIVVRSGLVAGRFIHGGWKSIRI